MCGVSASNLGPSCLVRRFVPAARAGVGVILPPRQAQGHYFRPVHLPPPERPSYQDVATNAGTTGLARVELGETAANTDASSVRLVLLHGFTLTSTMWRPVLHHLEAISRTRRDAPPISAVGIDLPGHGSSPTLGSVVSFADMATATAMAIARCRDTSREHSSLVVVGYSMGGRLAWSGVSEWCRPGDVLGLIGAHPGDLSPAERAERRSTDAGLAARLVESDLADWMSWWVRRPMFDGLHACNDFMAERLTQDRLSLAWALRSASVADQPDALEPPGRSDVPIRYLAGLSDTKYRHVAERLSAGGVASSTVIPGSHALPLVHAAPTAEWIFHSTIASRTVAPTR